MMVDHSEWSNRIDSITDDSTENFLFTESGVFILRDSAKDSHVLAMEELEPSNSPLAILEHCITSDQEKNDYVYHLRHQKNVNTDVTSLITAESIRIPDLPSALKVGAAKSRGHVRFNKVRIREYSITLGDHPLSQMYPLSLDWTYNELGEAEVNDDQEDFEKKIVQYKKAFRKVSRLTAMERRARLVETTGTTDDELCILEKQRKLRLKQEQNDRFFSRAFPVVKKIGMNRLHFLSIHEQRLQLLRERNSRHEYHLVVC